MLGIIRYIFSNQHEILTKMRKFILAFLVSAKRVSGKVVGVEITPEAGGIFRIRNPFESADPNVKGTKLIGEKDGIISVSTTKGKTFSISAK